MCVTTEMKWVTSLLVTAIIILYLEDMPEELVETAGLQQNVGDYHPSTSSDHHHALVRYSRGGLVWSLLPFKWGTLQQDLMHKKLSDD